MKLLFASTLSVGVVTALMPRAPTAPPGYCCFTLTASNPKLGSAIVEEDTIGQNRIFSSYPDGAYCINPADKGKLYDSLGHTCIISQSSQRFQCTQGIRSQNEFAVGGNGDFFVDGDNDFWACPSQGPGNDGSYEIFAQKKPDTTNCVAIMMASTGDACVPPSDGGLPVTGTAPSGTAPAGSTDTTTLVSPLSIVSTPPSSTDAAPVIRRGIPFGDNKAVSVSGTGNGIPAPTTTRAQCPKDLSAGNFVSPSLIVPVSREDAGHSYGNIASPIITPSNNTLFSFDIPSSWTGQCSLLFTFPYANEAANPGAYHFSGIEEEQAESGGLNFDLLSGNINSSATWWTKPALKQTFGKTEIIPGNSYTIATFACPSAKSVVYDVSSVGNVEIEFLQSAAAKPIGLWVVKC